MIENWRIVVLATNTPSSKRGTLLTAAHPNRWPKYGVRPGGGPRRRPPRPRPARPAAVPPGADDAAPLHLRHPKPGGSPGHQAGRRRVVDGPDRGAARPPRTRWLLINVTRAGSSGRGSTRSWPQTSGVPAHTALQPPAACRRGRESTVPGGVPAAGPEPAGPRRLPRVRGRAEISGAFRRGARSTAAVTAADRTLAGSRCTARSSARSSFRPPGLGADSAPASAGVLYLGAIPVVERTGGGWDDIFLDLPVLLVDDFGDVTQNLEASYPRLLGALRRLRLPEAHPRVLVLGDAPRRPRPSGTAARRRTRRRRCGWRPGGDRGGGGASPEGVPRPASRSSRRSSRDTSRQFELCPRRSQRRKPAIRTRPSTRG